MNTFDGIAEIDAVIAALTVGTAATVFEGGVPDGVDVPVDGFGRTQPYIVVRAGQPVRAARGRGMGVGERKQPHILPMTIEFRAATAGEVKDLAGAGLDVLLDFEPSETATPLAATGGYSYTRDETETRPTQYVIGKQFTTTINL